ncbi:MAG: serine/threonine-protein kinase [bacterium]|nr:serine/threonine-protein kinase [bacterium]
MSLLHNRYRMVSHVADGGQGSIYVVFDQSDKSHKVAKIYKHKHSRFLTPFVRESLGEKIAVELYDKLREKLPWVTSAQRLKRFLERQYGQIGHLHHSGILKPQNVILEEPYCIIMKLIKGGSMRSRLRKKGTLSLDELGVYLAQLANILSYLHSIGVVHRDLKPENILIESEGEISISDFDFAHFRQAWPQDLLLSSHYRNKGTANYMSPEHLRGAIPHHGMDIFSLAVTAYEALTGDLPFGSKIKDRDSLDHYKPVKILNERQNNAFRRARNPDRTERTACAVDFYKELYSS